jgi:hypothetical protein
MLWFVGITTAATFAIALFNWQLVRVTHDMKQATVDAAKASKDSAEAARESAGVAKVALQLDRPVLTIESVELKHFWPASQRPKKAVMASFVVRNHGRAVATSISIKARLDIVEFDWPDGRLTEPPERTLPQIGNHYRCKPLLNQEQAIAPSGGSSVYEIALGGQGFPNLPHPERSFLTDEMFAFLMLEFKDFAEIKDAPRLISLHVVIEYPDPTGRQLLTESIWRYIPSHDPDTAGRFFLWQFKA